jgi:hypothetical protein
MKKSKKIMVKKSIIGIHILLGASVFYFLVHPFTMVLYWFEYSQTPFSISFFLEILNARFLESFSFNMRGMGGLLTVFGSILGLFTGLIWVYLKKKDTLISTQQRLLQKILCNS